MRNATSSSPKRHATAALAVALATSPESDTLPEGMNVQLFPDGDFTARDGRPGSLKGCSTKAWRLDADIAATLITRAGTSETPLFIDYEHHTLTTDWIEALACVQDIFRYGPSSAQTESYLRSIFWTLVVYGCNRSKLEAKFVF